nr:hypothetical protein [Sphingopyxis flava]
MICHRPDLAARQPAADRPHLAQRIIVARAVAKRSELRSDIGGGLARQRRIAGPCAFAGRAVAGCAGREIATGIPIVVESGSARILKLDQLVRGNGQARIIGGDLRPVATIEPPRDRAHHRMVAASAREIVELAMEITLVEAGEPR